MDSAELLSYLEEIQTHQGVVYGLDLKDKKMAKLSDEESKLCLSAIMSSRRHDMKLYDCTDHFKVIRSMPIKRPI